MLINRGRHRARKARAGRPRLVALAAGLLVFASGHLGGLGVATNAAWSDAVHATAVLTTSQWMTTAPTALALSNTTARVTWTGAEGHTAYTVQRATNSAFTTGLVNTNITGTTLEVAGLAQNTTYYFRIRGQKNASLPWSAVASAKTGPGSAVKKVALMTSDDIRNPHGIVVDAANQVWAADYYHGKILRVPATGGAVATIVGAGLIPDHSMRQIALAPSTTNVAWVSHMDSGTVNPWASSKEGVWTRSGSGVKQLTHDAAAYGITFSPTTGKYYYAGANSAGVEARSLFECTAAGACTKIWDSPSWMAYLSIPAGSDDLVIGMTNRIYKFNVKSKEASVIAALGGDIRGVFSPKDNLYFLADYSGGQVWKLTYNPTTGATSSVLLLTGLPKSRAMATTAAGDLIVANSSSGTADVAMRGVWKYAGLGK